MLPEKAFIVFGMASDALVAVGAMSALAELPPELPLAETKTWTFEAYMLGAVGAVQVMFEVAPVEAALNNDGLAEAPLVKNEAFNCVDVSGRASRREV